MFIELARSRFHGLASRPGKDHRYPSRELGRPRRGAQIVAHGRHKGGVSSSV